MNREILFKGKRIRDKSWMYGYYIQCPQTDGTVKHCIAVGDSLGVSYYEIDPNTLCQYIGAYDSNGVEIFEGDILRYDDMLKIQRYVKVIYDGVEFKGVWDKKGEYLRCDLCYWTNERIIKVVGNVFDNPEMMERGKE